MTTAKRTAYAALLVAALAAGALTAGSQASTPDSRSLTYTVRNARTAYLTKTGLSTGFPGTLQTGDEIFTRDTLLQGSTQVGYDNETCTVTFDNNDLCRVASVFAGQGETEATWLWINRNSSEYGPSHFSGVIDGGTGSFEHATGQFDATALPNGTLRITASLG
jgi:hypothetical protein